MDLESLHNYCLSLKGSEESQPFGPENIVLKVKNKIFGIIALNDPLSINLKCDPEKALELREQFSFVQPGYHMNKKHWNTIILEDIVTDRLVKEWIDHSYKLIVNSLSSKEQKELHAL